MTDPWNPDIIAWGGLVPRPPGLGTDPGPISIRPRPPKFINPLGCYQRLLQNLPLSADVLCKSQQVHCQQRTPSAQSQTAQSQTATPESNVAVESLTFLTQHSFAARTSDLHWHIGPVPNSQAQGSLPAIGYEACDYACSTPLVLVFGWQCSQRVNLHNINNSNYSKVTLHNYAHALYMYYSAVVLLRLHVHLQIKILQLETNSSCWSKY